MRKAITIAVFVLFLLIPSVLAAGIELTVPTSLTTVYIGQHNEVDITIKNTQSIYDTFLISTWPTQWISLEQYGIGLAAGETKTVTLSIDPPRTTDKGIYEIGVTAKSTSTSASESKSFLADFRREFDLYISDVKVNSQIFEIGDNLVTNVVVTNLNTLSERNVIVTTSILKDNLLVQKFDDEVTIEPLSAETISNSIEIKNTFEFGTYKLKIELKDVIGRVLDDSELAFSVKRSDEFTRTKATEFGLFYLTTRMTVTNNGNVPDATYTLTESVPSYFKTFFFPDVEPKSQQEVDGRIVYTWELKGMKPGESRIILYQIRFTTVVVAILLVGLGLYVFNYFYFRPHIHKRYPPMISMPKEEAIHLHVRNRSRHEIKNIVVKDYIPPLARVVKKFETVTPEIKLTTKGTLLTWKIDRLGLREERVLSYRIIPVMEVPGGIQLPKAHFTYEGKKHPIDQIAQKVVERLR